jgi:hypothetical protein
MIKQHEAVRARLLKLMDESLFVFRTHVTMLPKLEADILKGMEPFERRQLASELTDLLLAKFSPAQTPNISNGADTKAIRSPLNGSDASR